MEKKRMGINGTNIFVKNIYFLGNLIVVMTYYGMSIPQMMRNEVP